jgi:plastocyanin
MNRQLNKIARFSLTALATTMAIALWTFHQQPSSYSAQIPEQQATVTIQSFQFQPAEVTIKTGGTVTFVNKDSAPHTATPIGDTKFSDIGRLTKNQSKTVTFNRLGTYNYFCVIHPSMKGKVIVTQSTTE